MHRAALLGMILVTGCRPGGSKSGLDSCPDSGLGAEGDTMPAPGDAAVPGDHDGDGVTASRDCDDDAPWMWEGSATYEGDISLDDDEEVADFCGGACTVELAGSLTITGAVTDLSPLSCLTAVDGASPSWAAWSPWALS